MSGHQGNSDWQARSAGDLACANSPLWHISHVHHPESSLRSTLQDNSRPDTAHAHPPPHHTDIPAAPPPSTPIQSRMAIQNFINPASVMEVQPVVGPAFFTPINSSADRRAMEVPMWTPADTPSDRPWKLPTNSAFYAHNVGHPAPPGFNVDFHEYHTAQIEREGQLHFASAESLQIPNDGRMYHKGHEVGTYSGTWIEDKPDAIAWQARKKINHMKEQKQKPLRVEKCAEYLHESRCMLEAGALLVLQRASFVDEGETIPCLRPFCPAASAIPANSYYLSLECDESRLSFCLHCFEELWNGKYTEDMYLGQPGISQSQRRDSGIHMSPSQLDGPPYSPITPPRKYPDPCRDITILPSTNDIFKFRHAEAEDLPSPTTPLHLSDEDLDDWSSPSSTTSTGEWRHPPTRFQHLASFVKEGGTLSAIDKAALALWKEASRDQLHWERHLLKMKYTHQYYEGRAKEDRGLDMERDKVGEEWDMEVDVDELRVKTGVRKKDCYGRDLSEVFREVKAKEKETQM